MNYYQIIIALNYIPLLNNDILNIRLDNNINEHHDEPHNDIINKNIL